MRSIALLTSSVALLIMSRGSRHTIRPVTDIWGRRSMRSIALLTSSVALLIDNRMRGRGCLHGCRQRCVVVTEHEHRRELLLFVLGSFVQIKEHRPDVDVTVLVVRLLRVVGARRCLFSRGRHPTVVARHIWISADLAILKALLMKQGDAAELTSPIALLVMLCPIGPITVSRGYPS